MPIRGLCSAILIVSLSGIDGYAQPPVEDRPQELKPTSGPAEDADRRAAEQLLRDAQAKYGVAIMRRRRDRLLEASEQLETARRIDPNSREIARALVPVYASLGRDDEAMQICRKILTREPTDLDIAFQFGRMLKDEGRTFEACAVLRRAVQGKEVDRRPERGIFVLQDLGEMLDGRAEYEEAAKSFDRMTRLMLTEKENLLFGNGITRDGFETMLAGAFEKLGRSKMKSKDFDGALNAFRSGRDALLRIEDPESRRTASRFNWNLCEIAVAQQQWEKADEYLNNYLKADVVATEAFERKVEILVKSGRQRDVVPTLRKLSQSRPDHVPLRLIYARELGRDLKTRLEAERIFGDVIAKGPTVDAYRGLFQLYMSADQAGRIIDAVDAAAKVLQGKDTEVSGAEREKAAEQYRLMTLVLRRDPALARFVLPTVLADLNRTEPRTIDTWSFMAALAYRVRQLDRAETLFRQCLVNVPPEAEAKVYGGLIDVLWSARKYERIIDLCQEVISGRRSARNTNVVLFHASLARAAAESGRFPEAISAAESAIKLSSDRLKVQQMRQRADILAQAGRFDDAVKQCAAIIVEFPQADAVRVARYGLSNVHSLRGEHEKSEEQLLIILESDPDAPLANNNLGYQWAERNVRLDEAEQMIRRAIDIDRSARRTSEDIEDNAAYLDSLGWVLFRKGRMDEALQWLKRAAELPEGADDAVVWDHLGDVHFRLNNSSAAKESWEKCLRLLESSHRPKSDSRRSDVSRKIKSMP